jgi:hypothetical protein
VYVYPRPPCSLECSANTGLVVQRRWHSIEKMHLLTIHHSLKIDLGITNESMQMENYIVMKTLIEITDVIE